MKKFLQFPHQTEPHLEKIPKIHENRQYQKKTHSVQKPQKIRQHHSCQTEIAIKKRIKFDTRIKSFQKKSSRYSPLGEKAHYILKNNTKNIGVISQLFNAINKDKNNISSDSIKSDQKYIKDLKEQLFHLAEAKNQMAVSSIRRKNSKRKNSTGSSLSTRIIQVTHKQMKDYSEFIKSKTQNYYTQINFGEIRENDKIKAFSFIKLNQYRLIESVNLCVIDALKKVGQINQKLIKEYCGVYLRSQEIKKIEVFLNFHFFKAFTSKIRSLFVYEKIYYYVTSKLAEHSLLNERNFAHILLPVFEMFDLSIKSMLQTVQDLMSKSPSNIMQTFRSLKIVKQLQSYIDKIAKNYAKLSTQIEELSPSVNAQLSKTQIQEIYLNMRPFLGQSNFYHKVQEFQSRSETILNWKLFKIPPIPFLPTKSPHAPKYTLVIGLNQVLINYTHSTKVLKYRSFMDTFLQKIMNKFEIIVFSQFDKNLTDRIIHEIQRTYSFFQYRLYNVHLAFIKGNVTKDIKSIGRDLKHLIFLDQDIQSGHLIQQNWMKIVPFRPTVSKLSASSKQNHLLSALNDLLMIIQKQPEDIRNILYKTNSNLTRIPQVSSLEEKSLSITPQNQIKHY